MDEAGLVAFVAESLAARADAERAAAMAAYMKTDMPFYGVQRAGLREILRELKTRFPLASSADRVVAIEALWARPHREEKYLAIDLVTKPASWLTLGEVPLLRRLIVEGAWWDFVDQLAAHGVGEVLSRSRPAMSAELDRWIDDPDMWIRRSALIAQLRHKDRTDEERLFRYALARAHEKGFFIRKAIGWALREYAKTAPDSVREFVLANREAWSGLTFREATKHLDV